MNDVYISKNKNLATSTTEEIAFWVVVLVEVVTSCKFNPTNVQA